METKQMNTRAEKVDSIRKHRTIAKACCKALAHYDILESRGIYVPPVLRHLVEDEQARALSVLNASLNALRI